MTNESTRLSNAKRVMDSMAAGDVPALRTLLHADAQWHVPPSVADFGLQPTMSGATAIYAMVEQVRSNFYKDISFEHLRSIVQGDLVFLLARLSGTTYVGPDYRNDYAILMRFDGELVVEGWEFTDTAYSFKLMENAGVAHAS